MIMVKFLFEWRIAVDMGHRPKMLGWEDVERLYQFGQCTLGLRGCRRICILKMEIDEAETVW